MAGYSIFFLLEGKTPSREAVARATDKARRGGLVADPLHFCGRDVCKGECQMRKQYDAPACAFYGTYTWPKAI